MYSQRFVFCLKMKVCNPYALASKVHSKHIKYLIKELIEPIFETGMAHKFCLNIQLQSELF